MRWSNSKFEEASIIEAEAEREEEAKDSCKTRESVTIGSRGGTWARCIMLIGLLAVSNAGFEPGTNPLYQT
jgi:hypothetical protein